MEAVPCSPTTLDGKKDENDEKLGWLTMPLTKTVQI